MLHEQAEHMDAPDRCSSPHESSCTAGVVHTWLNDHIIAQLRWCRGRPTHHVSRPPLRREAPEADMRSIWTAHQFQPFVNCGRCPHRISYTSSALIDSIRHAATVARFRSPKVILRPGAVEATAHG